jgi:hypothetical protein
MSQTKLLNIFQVTQMTKLNVLMYTAQNLGVSPY